MTVQGRTTPRWGRDKSARWDSHAENGYRTRSYPARPVPEGYEVVVEVESVDFPGRPGCAERSVTIVRDGDRYGGGIIIKLRGWYETPVELNERQARFLRDQLNDWLPPD